MTSTNVKTVQRIHRFFYLPNLLIVYIIHLLGCLFESLPVTSSAYLLAILTASIVGICSEVSGNCLLSSVNKLSIYRSGRLYCIVWYCIGKSANQQRADSCSNEPTERKQRSPTMLSDDDVLLESGRRRNVTWRVTSSNVKQHARASEGLNYIL